VARLAVRLDRARDEAPADFDWQTAAEHCRISYLRGRFLATGSLSLAGGRTHLEFVVPADEAPRFAERLAALGMPAAWRQRRGSGVVTWKGAETITRFLRRCGASASLLELEARLVARSLRADLNRLINAEQANLERSVSAAARQSAAIETLETTGQLARLPEVERSVAEARRESPEASLTELAARLGLARAHVQRSLARIESLALTADQRASAR
jgi:DNA-binding protein WhiA